MQIVRLIVLYEDLKLELRLMWLPENKTLDEVSEHYRHTYILHRLFATLLEVDSALIQLNAHATFKRELPKFPANQLRDWKAAINFFTANKKLSSRTGATFTTGTSRRTFRNTSLAYWTTPKNRSVCSRSKFSDDHSTNYVFKVTETLVNAGLFYDSAEQDQRELMEESTTLVLDAIRHANLAIGALADHYILLTFGWE